MPARLPGIVRIFAGLALIAGAAFGKPAGGCAPGLREIFDFQAGDLFEDHFDRSAWEGDQIVQTGTVRKYRIDSRKDSGSARIYTLSGRQVKTVMAEDVIRERTYADFRETRTYADTAGNPFDGCPGDIVPMPEQWGVPLDLATRVDTAIGDTRIFPLSDSGLVLKILGRETGVLRDSVFHPGADGEHLEAYAAGLGLVRWTDGGSAGTDDFRLTGYVKGGDTSGTVSPDSRFEGRNAVRPMRKDGSAAPGPEGDARYDARGRRDTGMGGAGPDPRRDNPPWILFPPPP